MNRNTVMKYVPPLNIDEGQPTFEAPVAHFTAPKLSSNICLNGNSMSTMNSLSSQSSTNCGSGSSPLENLPKKFVSSMRTLFDIMDDKRTGFVRLSDIEARWQDDGSKGLPHGVIDCLRRVTPVSGMLSFERFCAGLKICLLRNQTNDCPVNRRLSVDSINSGNSSNNSINNHKSHINTKNNLIDFNNGNYDDENDKNNNKNKQHQNNISTNSDENNNSNNHKSNRATSNINSNSNGSGSKRNDEVSEDRDDEYSHVNRSNINKNSDRNYNSIGSRTLKINNEMNMNENSKHIQEPTLINGDTNKTVHLYSRSSLPVQRTLSLPKLCQGSDGDSFSDPYIMTSLPSTYAPPKPPRTGLLTSNGSTNLPDTKDRYDKAEIRNALQNWQMNVLMNEWEAKDKRRTMAIPNTRTISRGTADGSSTSTMATQQPITQQTSLLQSTPNNSNVIQSIYPTNRSPTLLEFQKKSHRRREIRRHTLQNGIDYNVLKRIRHLEEEKDLLLDGLHAIEKAQEWYFKQIALIQDKMKRLSRGDGHLEQWSEVNKERFDLQRARIMDVNRHLASLEDSWGKDGFPMHMNLAVRNHSNNGGINSNTLPQSVDVQINQFKAQNRQLTEEVSQKSERITDLEMERKLLYREILQYQQQHQQLQQQLIQKQGHILCENEEVIF